MSSENIGLNNKDYNSMAWWGHNLLLRAFRDGRQEPKEENPSGVLPQAVKDLLYNHFLTSLHLFFGLITYSYLVAMILVFFFQDKTVFPPLIIKIVDSLSEPYLGVIGVYLLIKEIRIRRGIRPKFSGDFLVSVWLIFFALSSLLTIFSRSYHFNHVYNLIITNSLAALIIRLGTVLHF